MLGTSNVFALTLKEALIQTYKNNTELNAERENIKVSEEDFERFIASTEFSIKILMLYLIYH